MENNLISIDIATTTHTTVTRAADPNERWDGDDLDHSFSIDGWYRTDDGPYRIDPEKPVYAVYVIYSTGDSFHREDGVGEVMMVNQNLEMAEKNVEILNTVTGFSVDLYLDDGSTFKQSVPFAGYFERLQDVMYEQVTAVSKPKYRY